MGSLGARERNYFPKLSSVSFPGSWGWTAGHLVSKLSCGHCIRAGTMGCAHRHCLVAQLCPTLCDPMDCSPPGSSVHGESPGKYARVGCHPLLQGIFPTKESNPGLPHCRRMLYRLSCHGLHTHKPSSPKTKPRTLTTATLLPPSHLADLGSPLKTAGGNSLVVQSGKDSRLSLLRVWVQSLVGELRSHKPHHSSQ